MSSVSSLRVGVSIYVRKGAQSLWENGIFQNCLFLAMLLQKSPIVDNVVLVAGSGDGDMQDAMNFLQDSPVPVIDMASAINELDVMIEMSAQLAKEWMIDFKAKGGKVVSMRVGNDYVIDIERMLFDKPSALLITGAPYDEVWTLPEYEKTCMPYFSSTFRAPVRIMPHLWSPVILNRACEKLPEGEQFGYQPGRKRWRIGIFEPNMCMVKTSYMPMLVCESAHRLNPDFIEHIYVCNTLNLKKQNTFNLFAQSLDIIRHGLTSFEGRYPIWQVVSSYCEAIVCHQWENAQNYIYYEALYGGYPLIHNSHLIGDCGYRYHDFDCEEGGQSLADAYKMHDENLASYREQANIFLATLDPEAECNVRSYTEALESLFKA
ncbi:MAG: DUF2827 domain-containing protein [Snodgrassella sp.]|uniref:DUF2827 domain-containing protein n=1 Tax=Snodgrassella sp. TaxID=2815304 RepID=UPI002586E4C6|nr:DUF2827 domain-containing protein [Snodgrassella sp.]MCO6520453.1 DUF2827 domain-containing protein [Snodgrassella sp.]